MNRPTPRRSSLAGSSPVTPPSAVTPAPPVSEPTPVRARPATPRGNKVSFYQSPDDAARMRAALLNTQALTGTRGLSDFIARACMVEVERLEQQYNAGKQWDPIGPGRIPTGRPMGE